MHRVTQEISTSGTGFLDKREWRNMLNRMVHSLLMRSRRRGREAAVSRSPSSRACRPGRPRGAALSSRHAMAALSPIKKRGQRRRPLPPASGRQRAPKLRHGHQRRPRISGTRSPRRDVSRRSAARRAVGRSRPMPVASSTRTRTGRWSGRSWGCCRPR